MTSTVLPYFVFQSYSFTRWTKNNIPKTYSGNLFEIHLDNFCLFINFKPKLVQYSFELTQQISKIISKASVVGVGCDIKMVLSSFEVFIYSGSETFKQLCQEFYSSSCMRADHFAR